MLFVLVITWHGELLLIVIPREKYSEGYYRSVKIFGGLLIRNSSLITPCADCFSTMVGNLMQLFVYFFAAIMIIVIIHPSVTDPLKFSFIFGKQIRIMHWESKFLGESDFFPCGGDEGESFSKVVVCHCHVHLYFWLPNIAKNNVIVHFVYWLIFV